MGFIYDNPDLEYESIKNAVLSFYSPSSDIWQKINAGSATSGEVLRAFSYIPEMQVVRSTDGTRTLGYDYRYAPKPTIYADDFDDIVGGFNSNNSGGGYSNGYSYNFPGYAQYNGGGPNDGYNFLGGARDGGGSTIPVIADKVSLAIAGVNIGAKLGTAIDSALYSLNPRWWDEHYPSINPQTWDSICTTEGGKSLFRILFGIPSSGNPSAYISVDALAYTYQLMRDNNFWGDGAEQVIPPEQTIEKMYYPGKYELPITVSSTGIEYTYGSQTSAIKRVLTTSGSAHFYVIRRPTTFTVQVTSNSPGTIHRQDTFFNPSTGAVSRVTEYDENLSSTTFKDPADGTFYYFTTGSTSNGSLIGANIPYIVTDADATNNISTASDIEYMIEHGTIEQGGSPEGVSRMPDSTQYPPTRITGTTTEEVLQQLRQEYPDLFNDSIHTSTLQDDGNIRDDEYVPIPWVDVDSTTDDEVITGDTQQTDTEIQLQDFIDLLTDTINPPDTGEGSSDPFVLPTGNASSLWAVYHPSQSELNAFGAWLWSSDFVEQIKRLFNDPMQAIIGVHKVFAPIPTGGSQTIKCGYLDSGVSSPVVSSQYTEVNCGTVNCREYFGNVFDYDPHTKVSIYLPFIGVVPLKVSEVMRASINVTYGVDVITGACLAKVKVERDGGGAILYSYGGSCACHYPISSGSYAGIISGIVTSAIGIAGGIATGNPLSAVGGAVAGLHQAHTDVQRSGGFTGCAGAMGPKKPYLIIDRPQTRLAKNFAAYDGKPSNSTQFIGDCTGFIRAQEVHFSAPGAFDDEAKEIEALLKSGVLISD